MRQFRKIKKRSGHYAKFDSQRIVQALIRAGEATGEFDEKSAKKLALKVLSLAHETIDKKVPSVEEIQDIVEEVLLSSPYRQTAKAYILYRDQRTKARELADKTSVDLVDKYLDKLDWRVKENSNMTYSLQGLNTFVYSEFSKTYWLNKVYPPEIKKAHLSGDFHIHDLGLLSVYCVGWDLYDLLLQGFRGVSAKVESNAPKHFRSALGQVVNFFYTLQGEAAGAVAFSNFDTLLAPFIRYDKLSYREVKQSLQEFMFNMNVPTRVGFQTPFTNVTIDLNPSVAYADDHVIIGGKPQKERYKDFQKEMDVFNKAFMEVLLEGDAKGQVFSFPIPTYNITKDFDWDNPRIKLLWEMTAKYGVPYFSNFVNSDMKPEDARSMCCRLRLDKRTLKSRGGGLFGSNPLTGSIGVVTINLPRIGYLAKNKKDFFKQLGKKMDLARDSLLMKRKILEQLTHKGLYPYSKHYLKSVKDRTGKYWDHHFSTIGLVGMNEACLNFSGQGVGEIEGREFALEVMDFMRERMTDYQKKSGHLFNLEATPAESTAYRLARLDKKAYSKIICANEKQVQAKGAEPFYTNSSQLPVDFTDDLFEVLDHQDDLQTKYTGGTVVHLFVGEKIGEPQTVKNLVQKICNRYHLPYFTITPTFSICPVHGYLKGEQKKCPECGAGCEVYSRVVGYMRPVSQWNDGKQAEYNMRKVFKIE